MVKKRGILLRIITGTVMLILVVVSALVQTEPAAAAGSGISKVSFDGYLKGVENKGRRHRVENLRGLHLFPADDGR